MRGVIVVWLLAAASARAEEAGGDRGASGEPGRHLAYVEVLGKGGLYAVGYEYAIADGLGVGGAGSFAELRDEQTMTLSSYVHVTALSGERHALFGELGAIFAHTRVPSPVMGWDGVADSGAGGYASIGWEYRRGHLVLRTSGSLAAGEGGVAPMVGFAIGARP